MDESFRPDRLLGLRRLTRAVSEPLRQQAAEYVATLTPLLRPRNILGDYADGATKDPMPAAERALKELQSAYESTAVAKPFDLLKEMKLPLELLARTVELSPLEYTHVARGSGISKPVKITSPLKWVLSYQGFESGRLATIGFTPRRLKEQLTGGSRSTDELRKFVLHYLALNLTITKQPGVLRVFSDLRFPLTTIKADDFGPLPLTCISSIVSTLRPPDDLLIEHTEIAGTDSFEEVVNANDIAQLSDPLGDKLREMAKTHGALPAAPA